LIVDAVAGGVGYAAGVAVVVVAEGYSVGVGKFVCVGLVGVIV